MVDKNGCANIDQLVQHSCTGSHRVWKRKNREKNNGQGKVREFYFGPKVREKSGNYFFLVQKSGYFFPEGLNAAISIKY